MPWLCGFMAAELKGRRRLPAEGLERSSAGPGISPAPAFGPSRSDELGVGLHYKREPLIPCSVPIIL